jgi:hypothetical protein
MLRGSNIPPASDPNLVTPCRRAVATAESGPPLAALLLFDNLLSMRDVRTAGQAAPSSAGGPVLALSVLRSPAEQRAFTYRSRRVEDGKPAACIAWFMLPVERLQKIAKSTPGA